MTNKRTRDSSGKLSRDEAFEVLGKFHGSDGVIEARIRYLRSLEIPFTDQERQAGKAACSRYSLMNLIDMSVALYLSRLVANFKATARFLVANREKLHRIYDQVLLETLPTERHGVYTAPALANRYYLRFNDPNHPNWDTAELIGAISPYEVQEPGILMSGLETKGDPILVPLTLLISRLNAEFNSERSDTTRFHSADNSIPCE